MARTNDKDLLELARSKIIETRVGLLSTDELSSWADDQIRRLSKPPYYLIAISIGDEDELRDAARLDLVLQKPDDNDCAALAMRILKYLEEGRLSIDELEGVALRCGQVLDTDTDCWQQFDWISDELYLAREGVKDQAKSQAHVLDLLKKMAR